MNTASVRNPEFELAYLALLTKEGVKPLSRWEKTFDGPTEKSLQAMGLKTRIVERSVSTHRRLHELLFSASDQCLALYAARFDGTPIARDRAAMCFEGLLFGYPACCVESYAAHGYAANSLRQRDQRILFHWACPHCAVTPLLLPHYRRAYRACRRATRGRVWSLLPRIRSAAVPAERWRALAMAVSLAAVGTLAAAPAASTPDPLDPHVLSLPGADDPDQDFLSNSEEAILGTDPQILDQNTNAVPDGVDLAYALSAAIDALGISPSASQPYVAHHVTFGTENCAVCGTPVNMGFLTVWNPLESQTIDLPYVAKHCLEHGSFGYAGSVHSGRVNPALLKLVLFSEGQAHFIAEPTGTDADNDGLRQWEEPALGVDPLRPDSDGDQLLDGIDAAREMRRALDLLPVVARPEDGPLDRPFVVQRMMLGTETCPRCGESWPMGLWEIINPVTGDSISIPTMALHCLTHGGFRWQGGQLLGGAGRVDPRHLQAVLSGIPNRHLLPVTPDQDGDLLRDQEEQAIRQDPANPDENANTVRDGLDLARATVCEIAALQTTSASNQVYRLDFPLLGLEQCDICGTNVNMGHLTVCNPLAQLYVQLPYIALHYLEHDSFSFAGNVHGTGRADLELLLAALHSQGPSHMLRVSNDLDGDGLKDHEERRFGTDPAVADTNHDGLPDGFTLARRLWSEVEALPRVTQGSPPPAGPCYAVDHLLRGVVPCPVCAVNINMGFVEVINPKEHMSLNVPYLALHFLEHGSFGSSAQDRVNPCLLDVLLHGDGTAHLVAVSGDADSDGLLDAEEPHFGTRPDVADTDGDGVPDGIMPARQMHQRIQALPTSPVAGGPYLIHHETDCFAPCPVCGENFNCGNVEITNTWTGLSLRVSYLNLHFLERGSFAASPAERIDPLRLDEILQPSVVITAGETQITLRWATRAGYTYQLFTAPDVGGPWTPGPVFQGDGSPATFTEDKLAGSQRKFYRVVGTPPAGAARPPVARP